MAIADVPNMHTSKLGLAFATTLAITTGCSVETSAPPVVGDVGDTSGQQLKVGCNLSRDQILSSVQGGRRTAIERGFSWYDAQVPYSQSGQYDGYRTDCSGFVSMCWELGTSYTTANFVNDTSEWTSLASFDELLPADAMVYRTGSAGHIMMFVGWNDSAKTEACVLEQASTADDMQFRARTTDSLVAGGYHAIRASKFGSSGGKSDAANCYCDAECAQYGDCCSSCGGSAGSGSGGSGGSGGSSGSGSQCYCDAECVQYGDCCANCGSGGSGKGGSGGSGSQCYCDAECVELGDCCTYC